MGKFALLVGVSEYKHLEEKQQLPNAARDLEAMRNVLEPAELGGFEVACLNNPDKSTLEIAIYNLFTNRQKEDVVLFYFSGHGMRDKQFNLYFGLSATQQDQKAVVIPPTATDARYLHQQIGNSRSERQVIILDCCFSGAFAKGLIAKGEQAKLDIKPDELGGKGRAILTSSTSTQYSFAHEDSELSIYTHYLVEGIRTGAADLDSDGMISADELYRYTEEKIHQESPAMSPKFYPVQGGYRITVSNAPQGNALVQYRKAVLEMVREDHEDIDFIAGEFDVINRATLDEYQLSWGVEETEAAAIETEVMKPYRLRQEKLKKFEVIVTKATQKKADLRERDVKKLRRFQESLGLRDEDVAQWIPAEIKQVTQAATSKAPKRETEERPKSFTEELGNGVKLDMVLIPKGRFMMGMSDDEIEKLVKKYKWDGFRREAPQHRVDITQAFYMGKYQVTQGQWQAVMGDNPSEFQNGDDYPVEQVSWDDCHEFLEKLNPQTGKSFRLPSEAEWEYACRAGTTTQYYFGDDAEQLGKYAWFADNSGDKNIDSSEIWRTDSGNYGKRILGNNCRTHPVGQKKPNQFELFDMHGNVWEWCEDDFEDNYKTPRTQKSFVGSGDQKVLRGGAWAFDPERCRSAIRDFNSRGVRPDVIGFRVVVTPQ
ncbi:Sulphatase-modifying factor protein [[Leptolyngbya] sp. PCC 7376]|uniref:caspase, EACC1-associated type n=1 Tax=[Leptolyngbya] sp. PCC 7376 TaxID=111781 RepID=UPI00029F3BED|nr:SUMF1/EgtB/PvdO family nonheme iron enzyme [[Leptolyngbya] sp. PCC 7376]AFY37381.1 Sulphatase-modifying factor protein [[Leptolyngbya] sp. PCC 7376]